MDKQEVYCRLEIFCLYDRIHDLKYKQPSKKEKSLLIRDNNKLNAVEDYDVYVEEYDNFQSLEARIADLYDIWLNFCNKQERSLNTTEGINSYEGIVCISVMLYNRWGNFMAVGVSEAGWIVPYYYRFTTDYENNLRKRGKVNFEEKEKFFILYIPQNSESTEYECISRETAHSLIEEWLDTGDFTKHFFDESVYFDFGDETDGLSSIPF
jgi:hypothetical protein